MTDEATNEPGRRGRETATERKEQLAAALRQNLARRKAQGRARKTAGKDSLKEPPAEPDDETRS